MVPKLQFVSELDIKSELRTSHWWTSHRLMNRLCNWFEDRETKTDERITQEARFVVTLFFLFERHIIKPCYGLSNGLVPPSKSYSQVPIMTKTLWGKCASQNVYNDFISVLIALISIFGVINETSIPQNYVYIKCVVRLLKCDLQRTKKTINKVKCVFNPWLFVFHTDTNTNLFWFLFNFIKANTYCNKRRIKG